SATEIPCRRSVTTSTFVCGGQSIDGDMAGSLREQLAFAAHPPREAAQKRCGAWYFCLGACVTCGGEAEGRQQRRNLSDTGNVLLRNDFAPRRPVMIRDPLLLRVVLTKRTAKIFKQILK